ncbi:MFS transporter [Calidifontibacter indicus]|uniref:MFS transporter n=1 Tax=Calidifontibacter indicus TaxID=419650 RepID=UPI003D76142D
MSTITRSDESPVTGRSPVDRVSDTLPTGRARTVALISLFLASAMELIDVTIVNVALPSIEADLQATGSQLQWIIAAYPLAFAIALITGSRLGDRFGRKRLFVGGLVAFTLLSAACGAAPSAEMLVIFRALQGLAAAAMVPQVLSSLQVMYAPEERGKAMGAFTALAGISTVIGPVLGAVLTDLDIAGSGWRAIFLVNVPVGLLALVAALRWIPESRSAVSPGLNPGAGAVLAAGLLAVLYPLTMGRDLGWPEWGFALMVAGVVVLVGFVRHQLRAQRAGLEPLVNVELYRGRGFAGGTAVQMLLFGALSAYFLAQTIYFQAGLGWSVLKAGLVGVPFAIATSAAAGFGVTRLVVRIGRKVLQVGALVMAFGLVAMAVAVNLASVTTPWWAFVAPMVVTGVGFGLMVAPVGLFALADVPVEHAGSASGLFNTSGQLANAVGIAVIGSVFFEVVQSVGRAAPVDLFAPAFQVVLAIAAVLLLVSVAAARAVPAKVEVDTH